MSKPTKRKTSAKNRKKPDGESANVRWMDADELMKFAIGRLIEEALESKDAETWKRAMRIYCANQGKDAPMFQTNGAARGTMEIRVRARRMYETIDDLLIHCGPRASNEHVAAGLLRLFTATRYILDCEAAPNWRDVEQFVRGDYQTVPSEAFAESVWLPEARLEAVRCNELTVISILAIASEIAPIRRHHERPDPARIARAAARALGMPEKRIGRLFPTID